MKTTFQKTGGIIYSLFQIAIGILLLVDPIGLTAVILITLGIALAIMGTISVVNYFRKPIEAATKEQLLAKGLILILVGCFCVFCTEWIIATLPLLSMVYGAIMLIVGLYKVQLTFDSIRKKEKRWFLGLIGAVVSIACAIIIITNPFATTNVLWMFTGIAMIVDAVFDVFAILFGKNKAKEVATEAADEGIKADDK